MGCGEWFCSACLQKVKEVNYCRKCAATVGEDYRTLAEEIEADKDSPGVIRHVVADTEDQWEKGFRSAQMIAVTRKRLRVLKQPIDLSGTVAGVGWRVVAHVVDGVVIAGIVALVYMVATSLLLLGATVGGGELVLLAVSFLAGLAINVVLRFVLLVILGQTIGRLVVGIRIVDLRGKPARPIACFGRALFDTVFDVLLLPHLISLFLIRPARKKGSLADALVGTQTVRRAEWRAKAQDAIYQEDRAKLLGAEQ